MCSTLYALRAFYSTLPVPMYILYDQRDLRLGSVWEEHKLADDKELQQNGTGAGAAARGGSLLPPPTQKCHPL